MPKKHKGMSAAWMAKIRNLRGKKGHKKSHKKISKKKSHKLTSLMNNKYGVY
jgi:hypothetical protein